MNKNILILLGIIAVIAIFGVTYFLFFRTTSPVTTPPPQGAGTLPPLEGPAPQTSSRWPTEETLSIGTPRGVVTVKNFYPTMLGTDEGLVVLADNDQYDMKYDPTTGIFGMYLFTGPLDATRAAAEADLLAKLGLDKPGACKLTVHERVSPSVSASLAEKVLPLSFCGGGVQ